MKGKIKIGATVSPLTDREIDALAGSHHLFSSRSDVIEKAVNFMFCALNTGSLCECAEQNGIVLHGNMAGNSMVVPA